MAPATRGCDACRIGTPGAFAVKFGGLGVFRQFDLETSVVAPFICEGIYNSSSCHRFQAVL
jgi:hypothetical protein